MPSISMKIYFFKLEELATTCAHLHSYDEKQLKHTIVCNGEDKCKTLINGPARWHKTKRHCELV